MEVNYIPVILSYLLHSSGGASHMPKYNQTWTKSTPARKVKDTYFLTKMTTLGPHTTTQRPLNGTLRAPIVPYVALKTTPGARTPYYQPGTTKQHPESLHSPPCDTGDGPRTPYYHPETIEQHPETLYIVPRVALEQNPILPLRVYCAEDSRTLRARTYHVTAL